MTIAEPDARLWTEVKARGVEWPADVEEVAADLGTAWNTAADNVTAGNTVVHSVGGDVSTAWGDLAGGLTQSRTEQIGAGLTQVEQQLRQQGGQATAYAASLVRTKQGIHQVVNAYSPVYDWIPDPRNPNDPNWLLWNWLQQTVVDKATQAIQWLLQVESQGPDVDGNVEGPNASGKVAGITGDASVETGRWRAFGGAVNGDYSVGLHGSAEVNAPFTGEPIIDANLQAGIRARLDEIQLIDAGPVQLSVEPEVRVGPGANLTIDPQWENGQFDLNIRGGASPFVGGGLGANLSFDWDEIKRSISGG